MEKIKEDLHKIINKTLEDKLKEMSSILLMNITSQLEEVKELVEMKVSKLEEKFTAEVTNLKAQLISSKEEVQKLKQKSRDISNSIDEQQDRNLRNTLIFRKIPFDDSTEASPADTIDKVAQIVCNHCPTIGVDLLYKMNRDRKSNEKIINVSQQFSKNSADRRNAALFKRRTLKKENKEMEYRVAYPAVLLGRRKNSRETFTIIHEF